MPSACAKRRGEMAKKYGADETLAARAGILHDVTKALNAKQQLLLAEKWNVDLTDFERANPQLLHAKTARQPRGKFSASARRFKAPSSGTRRESPI